jgi:hypothetical protein
MFPFVALIAPKLPALEEAGVPFGGLTMSYD